LRLSHGPLPVSITHRNGTARPLDRTTGGLREHGQPHFHEKATRIDIQVARVTLGQIARIGGIKPAFHSPVTNASSAPSRRAFPSQQTANFGQRSIYAQSPSSRVHVHNRVQFDPLRGRESRRNAGVRSLTRGPRPTGHGSPGQRLYRCQGYYRQLADRLELLCHLDVFVLSADARSGVAGDRVRNPLGNIAVQ
jgi:hypothetical protein